MKTNLMNVDIFIFGILKEKDFLLVVGIDFELSTKVGFFFEVLQTWRWFNTKFWAFIVLHTSNIKWSEWFASICLHFWFATLMCFKKSSLLFDLQNSYGIMFQNLDYNLNI